MQMGRAIINEIDWDRLDRFVRGVGDAEERALLAAWVLEDPGRVALVDAMRTIGQTGSEAAFRARAQEALERLRRRIGPPAETP